MPFESRQQEKWAFATHQSFAKEWAAKTDHAHLPKRKHKARKVTREDIAKLPIRGR